MIYITGDIHGDPNQIVNFCIIHQLTSDDTVVMLGDVCLNYWYSKRDAQAKRKLRKTGVTFLCIHGNHEARPSTISSYKTKEWNGGTVWYEEEYPNILFAKDGDIFELDGKKCLVLGGAYSVDKYYRFHRYLSYCENIDDYDMETITAVRDIIFGVNVTDDILKKVNEAIDNSDGKEFKWWKDEQPSEDIKAYVEENINKHNGKVDFVFSHTCPAKYIPTEMFLDGLNQATVDNSTEKWLDKIEDNLTYKRWYCGHWHTNKTIDKMHFLFHLIETFPYDT